MLVIYLAVSQVFILTAVSAVAEELETRGCEH